MKRVLWKCVWNERNGNRCSATPCRIHTWNLGCSFVWFVLNKFDIIFTGLMRNSKGRKMINLWTIAPTLAHTDNFDIEVNSRFKLNFHLVSFSLLNSACCLLAVALIFVARDMNKVSCLICVRQNAYFNIPIPGIFNNNLFENSLSASERWFFCRSSSRKSDYEAVFWQKIGLFIRAWKYSNIVGNENFGLSLLTVNKSVDVS